LQGEHSSPRSGRTVIKAIGLALMCLAFLGALPAQPAVGHLVNVAWSQKEGCNQIKDPVTVYVKGSGVTLGRTVADVVAHTGWRHDDPDGIETRVGTIKRFTHDYDNGHGGCPDQASERANTSGPFHDRYHTRFLPAAHGLRHLYLTPHKEDWVASGAFGSCPFGSHAVEPGHNDPGHKNRYYQSGYYSGFDHARDRLIGDLYKRAAGHRRHKVTIHQWRNTNAVKQCNGWWSGAGGTVFAYTLGK
jgi:hypothetical protein